MAKNQGATEKELPPRNNGKRLTTKRQQLRGKRQQDVNVKRLHQGANAKFAIAKG